MQSSSHTSLEEARRQVAELAQSGLSVACFARQREVPVGRLYSYRRRVRLADQRQPGAGGFRELRCALPPQAPVTTGVCVQIGRLCSLEIGSADQAVLAAAFVRALGEASP